MKLIDEKLGGTTPLDIILKFDTKINNEVSEKDDEFDDWEEDVVPQMIANIGLQKTR